MVAEKRRCTFLAIENELEGVAWLHQRGLSIDTVGAFGEPVIFAVAQLNYKGLFTCSVRAGADVNAKNRDGLTLISQSRITTRTTRPTGLAPIIFKLRLSGTVPVRASSASAARPGIRTKGRAGSSAVFGKPDRVVVRISVNIHGIQIAIIWQWLAEYS